MSEQHADEVDRYSITICKGKPPTRWWCHIRGHFWNFTEVNMFGTTDVDCIECNRCAELRRKEADDED